MIMVNEHDQDVLPRCRRLGHEVAFGYCRQESGGKPCRLILDCWWERFDVRGFLQAHLTPEVMAQVERAGTAPPPPKVLSLLDLVQQAKERLAVARPEATDTPQRES
jgi:hypothetical protein